MARGQKKERKELTPEERLQNALVPKEEWPYELPEGWKWVTLGKLTDVIGGGTPSTRHLEYYEGGTIPWLSPADLSGYSDMFISRGQKNITQEGLDNSSAKLLPKGTVCLSSRAPIGYVVIAKNALCTNQGFKSFTPSEYIYPEFLYWYLKANKPMLESMASGTTFLELSGKKAGQIMMPLPSIEIQKSISLFVEREFGRLDEAQEQIQSVIDNSEERKQSILHNALTGKLTEQWRIRNHINREDWQPTTFNSIIANIHAGKNIQCDEHPPMNGQIGIVKVSAVTWGEYDEEESKTCRSTDLWNPDNEIKPGDFLFSRANTLELVGNCVIVRETHKKLMLSDKILKINFDRNADPWWILYFTRSREYRDQIENLSSGNQMSMRNVSQNNLRKVKIELPSIEEQHEVVRLLDAYFRHEKEIVQSCEIASEQIAICRKSILCKAFSGELFQ